ncbi:universal stress protein [Dissulfurirhabdus thermomarina]|uniref:Universal stress protein n=1 Tax=Dissulfurirhabdus thermomarina TaxID=1765737 RepID=A0A6N9TQQ5_DISTH|nr:universal stress protein [Dissulfurirhabdus thermomarina]NDY41777.1 universal stress protein [Dissulfurirhabdus thermomarina]NMX23981.1 universal stress protein [Dissulfurirhabdus thermomarina]
MKILVPFDGSPAALKAAAQALDLAADGGEVTLLTAIPDLLLPELDEELRGEMSTHLVTEARRQMDPVAREAEARGIAVRARTAFGHPPDVILDATRSEAYDLVVMGCRGRHGIAKVLLGSVSYQVSRLAPCSVLIVR